MFTNIKASYYNNKEVNINLLKHKVNNNFFLISKDNEDIKMTTLINFLKELYLNREIDSLPSILKKYNNSNEVLTISFEGKIDEKTFSYTISFTKSNIVNENLLIDNYVIVSTTSSYYKLNKKPMVFIEQNDDIYPFIKFIESINIETSTLSYLNINDELLKSLYHNLYSGYISKRNDKKLIAFSKIISEYLKVIFSDIKDAYYKITEYEGKFKYELYIKKQLYGKIVNLSFIHESSGTKKILNLFIHFYLAAIGQVVVIENFDTYIHDSMVEIIINMLSNIKGKIIATSRRS